MAIPRRMCCPGKRRASNVPGAPPAGEETVAELLVSEVVGIAVIPLTPALVPGWVPARRQGNKLGRTLCRLGPLTSRAVPHRRWDAHRDGPGRDVPVPAGMDGLDRPTGGTQVTVCARVGWTEGAGDSAASTRRWGSRKAKADGVCNGGWVYTPSFRSYPTAVRSRSHGTQCPQQLEWGALRGLAWDVSGGPP